MFSLMSKLFIAGVFISVVPLIIYQYISFEQTSKRLQLTYANELKHKTELTTLLINQAISHRISDLDFIAKSVEQWIDLGYLKSIEELFKQLKSTKHDLHSINLVNAQAKISISTLNNTNNINILNQHLKKLLNEYKLLQTNEIVVSELIVNNEQPYIYMIKKVKGYDSYVFMIMNFKNIELLLSNFEDEITGDKPVYIVDKNKHIILSTDNVTQTNITYKDTKKIDKHNQLDEGIYHFIDSKNDEILLSYDEVYEFGVNDALGWRVISSIPISMINEYVNQSLYKNKQISIVILIIVFIILMLLSRNIVHSIQKVIKVANNISSGDYSARVLGKNTTTEFQVLSSALNSMAQKIQTRTNKLEEQKLLLENLAHYDSLTQIPNRVLFKDRIEQAIVKAHRHKSMFALFYIDLDEFKQINDSFGHDTGDDILRTITSRVSSALREEDTFSRLGGDEFTIILEDLSDMSAAALIAEKVINTIKKPLKVDGHTFKVSTSIGISIYPKDTNDRAELIKFSDIAMYKAKSEGKDNYQFYSKEMTNQSLQRIKMKHSIEYGIENNEFEVHYQPQFNVSSNQLVGMEALIRWNHHSKGYIAPLDFLPLAQESNLIIKLDQWVMKTAMRQIVQWRKKGLNPGRVALNLSIKHLQNNAFMDILKSTLNETGCQADWIELEVTESHIMNDFEESIVKLKEINSLGIKVSVDDFGTGYSSLSYLKLLPIDKLKIDKSFVDDLCTSADDLAIVKAIIALCESLNLVVLAEGVETQEQSDVLVEHGCEVIQGYLYAKPQSSKNIEKNFLN